MKLLSASLAAVCYTQDASVKFDCDGHSNDCTFNQIGWQSLFNSLDADSTQNAVVSPVSIVGALYMLAHATTGEAQSEIYEVLSLGDTENPLELYNEVVEGLNANYTLHETSVANGIFYQTTAGVTKEFTEDAKDIFKGQLKPVNFAKNPEEATNTINEWVSQNTKNKIPLLYEKPLEEDTAVVLASTLYFKGSWAHEFKPYPSDPADILPCWLIDEEAARNGECLEGTEFMHMEHDISHKSFKNDKIGTAHIFEIPFQTSRNSDQNSLRLKPVLRIWQPEGFISDPEYDANFQQFMLDTIPSLQDDGKWSRKSVSITMPKFELDTNVDLIENLRKQGIETVFSGEADFSRLLGDELNNVLIRSADHAVNLNLDENGVEAAAVTAIKVGYRSLKRRIITDIDRPFYFSITNKCWDNKKQKEQPEWSCPFQRVPLFVGKVVNPLSQQ